MNNPPINKKPPDDWVKDLKPGDYIYDLILNRGICEVVACELNGSRDGYHRISFYIIGVGHADLYSVDSNGYFRDRRDLLPALRFTIPADAGDGE